MSLALGCARDSRRSDGEGSGAEPSLLQPPVIIPSSQAHPQPSNDLSSRHVNIHRACGELLPCLQQHQAACHSVRFLNKQQLIKSTQESVSIITLIPHKNQSGSLSCNYLREASLAAHYKFSKCHPTPREKCEVYLRNPSSRLHLLNYFFVPHYPTRKISRSLLSHLPTPQELPIIEASKA